MKPTRTFNGTPGEASQGVGGPNQIEHDIDELCAALDPNAVHENGAPGGIGWENCKGEIVNHNHDEAYAAKDHVHAPEELNAGLLNGGCWEKETHSFTFTEEVTTKTYNVGFALYRISTEDMIGMVWEGDALTLSGEDGQSYTIEILRWNENP